MIKIVCDINVLVSATYWSGQSNKILAMADKGNVTNILSHDIMTDYAETCNDDELMDKVERKKLNPLLTSQKITAMSILVHPKEKLKVIKDDPDDDKIIEAAVEGNADYIISYDNHLLKLKEYRGIKILTPKIFLNIIK